MDIDTYLQLTDGTIDDNFVYFPRIKTSILNRIPYDKMEKINHIYIKKLIIDIRLDNLPPYINRLIVKKMMRIKSKNGYIIKTYNIKFDKFFRLPFDCKLDKWENNMKERKTVAKIKL